MTTAVALTTGPMRRLPEAEVHEHLRGCSASAEIRSRMFADLHASEG